MNKKRKIKQNLQAYSFLLPNLILFIVCTLYPVVWALKYVFYQYGGYGTGEPRFVGFENLARVFRDSVCCKYICIWFWKNSIYYSTSFLSSLFVKQADKRKQRGAEHYFSANYHEFSRYGTCFLFII